MVLLKVAEVHHCRSRSCRGFRYSMSPFAQLSKFGPVGVGTYISVSVCTWTTLFIALENNLDISQVAKFIWGESIDTDEVLAKVGLKRRQPDDSAPETVGQYLMSKAPSFVLASVASKALVPVKIPISLAITPYVHRVLLARGLIRG